MSYEVLVQSLFYKPDCPFLFTTWFFWIFFVVLLTGYSLIYRRNPLRTLYLLVFSFYFYYKTGGPFIIALWFTILSDYTWGHALSRASVMWKKKFFLGMSIGMNLLLLGYFKYSEFLVDSLRQITGWDIQYVNHFAVLSNALFNTGFRAEHILVPVGVSFFTFQSMSYVWDIYHGKIQPLKKISDYAFFVCFFPHLVAGPIIKAHEFVHQIYAPYSLSRREFGMAVFWFLNGWMKKSLADFLAVQYIDRCFSSPHLFSGIEHVFSLFGYSLQVYMDFSGYTDMAIGIALLLGYRLKTNFLSPYKALSSSEFWKRWHISLSSWLKEYLYIPLGGNKSSGAGSWIALLIIILFLTLLSGYFVVFLILMAVCVLIWITMYLSVSFRQKVHQYLNIQVTMLLGGLWHGSSWMFVIWGGLNGLAILVHKTWERINPFSEKVRNHFIYKALCLILTLSFITYTRLFFRSPDMETVSKIHEQLLHAFHPELFFPVAKTFASFFILMTAGYLIHWIPEKIKNIYRTFFADLPVPFQVIVVIVGIIISWQLSGSQIHPFIYFQF